MKLMLVPLHVNYQQMEIGTLFRTLPAFSELHITSVL